MDREPGKTGQSLAIKPNGQSTALEGPRAEARAHQWGTTPASCVK